MCGLDTIETLAGLGSAEGQTNAMNIWLQCKAWLKGRSEVCTPGPSERVCLAASASMLQGSWRLGIPVVTETSSSACVSLDDFMWQGS